MKARCPTCDKVIDPTHAPVARIVGARVLTFCSQACADGKPEPEPEPELELELEPEPEPEPVARPKRRRQKKRDSGAPPDDAVDVELDSGPSAATALDAIDATNPIDEPVPSLRRRSPRGLVIGVSALLAAGGVAIVVTDMMSSDKTPAADTTPPAAVVDARVAEVSADAGAAPAPGPEPSTLREAALEALHKMRKSPSPRVARLAAMALARTGDPESLASLARLLETEPSQLNQVAIAAAMARAGDRRGLEALVSALSAKRRDVRADAAIALIRLDDRRGDKVLRSILHIRDHKIAAAGHLARAGDEDAKELLLEIYRDRRAEPEARMRAAVALGGAGVAEVADFLEKTLEDGRYRVGAAASLAVLKQEAARAPLSRQLELNAMRVHAAEALAVLGGPVDLTPLAVAMTHDDEISRVTAAEAVLILTAPSAGGAPKDKPARPKDRPEPPKDESEAER